MARNPKFNTKLALFLLIALAVSVGAEVKLRIYLQDGTLQAGNLIAETPETFVILTKEGRSEIKKDKIMFINGKTLKQWQERPDKLFQTEIIPSEIPNPAYVNDKAALPPVPVLSSQKPVVQPVTKPVVQKKPEPQPPVEKPKPTPVPAPQSVVAQAAPAPVVPVTVAPAAAAAVAIAPAPVAKPKIVNRHTPKAAPPKASVAAVPVKNEPPPTPKPVPRPAIKEAPLVAASIAAIAIPAKFSRKDFGDYHYQRAQAYLKMGSKGLAIQELHLATVLDRQNPESILLIGRLYMEQGENVRAEKYFSHPLIRKREEVKKFVDEMDRVSKKQEKKQWLLYAGTSIGLLVWIPMLVGWRRVRRIPVQVITAETIEQAPVEQPLVETLEPAEPAFKKILPVNPMAPPPLVVAKPVVEPPVAPTPPIEKPLDEQPPVKQPVIERPVIFDPKFEKSTAEILAHLNEPSKAPPPVPEPIPVAASSEEPVASLRAEPEMDTEVMLRVGSMVDKIMRQGNSYAMEEKFDLARREYRTALALRPQCAEAYLGLGYLCFIQGQWELALEHYVKCLEIIPNSADAHYGIGRVLLETDRVNEAVPEFQKTLSLDPTFDDARNTLTALGAPV